MNIIKKDKKIGQTITSFNKEKVELIEYVNANKCLIKFENGYKKWVKYTNFIKGTVKNPTYPSVFNKGYIGVGKYKVSINGKTTPEYSTWHSMLRRCYSKKFIDLNRTYIGCEVCDEWLNFQNFAKWFESNYNYNNLKYELDKDLLYKNNKIYSPNTCCFIPKEINALFTKRQNDRGAYPIGVTKTKRGFVARVNNKNKRIQGKYRKTPEEAFQDYKTIKENLIKQKAEKYKNFITKQVYNSLLKYKVDYND